MKRTLIKLAFVFLLVIFTTSAANASDGVSLTGTVLGISREYRSEGRYYYRVTLLLQFKNESDEPVIIIRPDSADGRLTFTKDYSVTASNSEVEGVEPTLDSTYSRYYTKEDPVVSFLDLLSKKTPAEYALPIIPPGGYFECRDSFNVENGYTFREEASEDPKVRPQILIDSEFARLKVEYRFSVAGRPEGIERVEKAKHNWKRFGKLLFDDDGKYLIKSAFIPNLSSN